MVEVCLQVIMALDSHIGPQAKALGPIWLPQCQYDLEAHLGHIITCIYCLKYAAEISSLIRVHSVCFHFESFLDCI